MFFLGVGVGLGLAALVVVGVAWACEAFDPIGDVDEDPLLDDHKHHGFLNAAGRCVDCVD